ncbi:BQ5605_C035g11397 [Microbotryum silenes-dioicae]|uniref:BQ5605_C035g11397 protein n=1 Tax=Microbotryum silenes-dioicae TaxID=796604 RepID=A0A2X0PAR6_9BASI|nr:BQ5605_C035g11397 [Microbotryum silenes-dioicae]
MEQLVPPSNQLSQLDLDHDHTPDVDTSREEVKTGAKAVVVKQTSPSALSRVPPELFYHIASCLTEGFQPKDIRLVYPDLRHGALVCRSWRAAFQRRLCLVVQLPRRVAAEGFLESGLTDRYPVELLTILPTGHARYRELAFVRDIGLTRRLLTMTPKSGTTPLRSISLLVSIANPLSATEFTREVTDGIKSTDFPDLRELEIVVTASLSNYKAGPMSSFSGLVVRRPPPEEAVSMSSLQNYIQGSKLWDELRRYCKTRRISLVIQGQVRE